MTIKLLSNTVTNQIWWGTTNQVVGVVNQLTDGELVVNGSITFTNSQFSLSAPSINISNSFGLTTVSGNSLFLFSSNAVINGTMFLTGTTGQNNSLYVANNAVFDSNISISKNLIANNLTVLNTDHLGSVYANGPGTSFFVSNNSVFNGNVNIMGQSVISNADIINLTAENLKVSNNFSISSSNASFQGTVYANSAGLSFYSENNTILNGATSINGPLNVTNIDASSELNINGPLFANGVGYSINVANSVYATGPIIINVDTSIYPGQQTLIGGNYGVIFRNDGANFYLGQTTSGNQFGNKNSYQPFSWNLSTGAVMIDSTGIGTTIGGNSIIQGNLAVNGSSGLNIVADTTCGGQLVVHGKAYAYNDITFYSNTVCDGIATFSGNINLEGTTTVTNPITSSSTINLTNQNIYQSLTAHGEIQSFGGPITGGQFRSIYGNYGVIFRNDGTNFYLLQTPSITNPQTSSWNSFRPFSWNLNNGQVLINGDGSGTTFGGPVSIAGAISLTSSSGINFNNGTSVGPSGASDILLNNPSGLTYILGSRVVPSSNFGYLSSTGSGVDTSTANPSVGLYINQIALGSQFFAFSDSRIKKDIDTLPNEEGLRFIVQSRPVTFKYKHGNTDGAGFIAQEQIKAGFEKSVTHFPDDKLEEHIDDDGFVSPKGVKLVKNYAHDNAYFVAFGKWVVEKLENMEQRITALENK